MGRLELEVEEVCPPEVQNGTHGVGELYTIPVFDFLLPLQMAIARTERKVEAEGKIEEVERWGLPNEGIRT